MMLPYIGNRLNNNNLVPEGEYFYTPNKPIECSRKTHYFVILQDLEMSEASRLAVAEKYNCLNFILCTGHLTRCNSLLITFR